MATTIDTTVPAPPRDAPPPTPTKQAIPRAAWLGFLVVIASAVMDLLDSTIAQTAAPAIRADLGGSYASIEWISAGYTLAMATTLLVGGRLGDLFGRRQVLLVGMAGFLVASVLCAFAPSAGALIGARALQGAVAGVMVPQGFGLIRELFGDEHQAKAFAVFGPVMGMSAVLGPVVGGGLVDLDLLGSGWRAIFLVNVPVGVAAIWLGLKHLPKVAPSEPEGRIDVVSVGLTTAGGFALIYPLIQGREQGWPAWTFAMLAASIVLLGTFGIRQASLARGGDVRRAPLVEPSIFKRRAYVSGLALVVCFIGAMGGMMLVLNVMFQAGLGFTPLGSGVAAITIPIAAIFGSITSSVTLDRLGRTTIHIGTATMAAGLVVVELVLRHQGGALSAWDLALPLAVAGFGMGMVFVPMFDVILAGVLPHQLGSAAGLLEAVQQLGMSLGIAIVGTVLFDAVGSGRDAAAFVGAADHGLRVAVGFLVAAFVVTWWLPRHARESH